MFKLSIQFIILLPALALSALPAGSDVKARERPSISVGSEAAVPVEENPLPCTELMVTRVGVLCKSQHGLVAHLDFPEVDLKSVLTGGEYLPQATAEFTADGKTVGDKAYRNISFVLRWEPATPKFLQIYLSEYISYWGNRVPYRLFWNARYKECSLDHCTSWITVNEKGEFLPSNVGDLSSDLAADININGVPAAFWNTNVSP